MNGESIAGAFGFGVKATGFGAGIDIGTFTRLIEAEVGALTLATVGGDVTIESDKATDFNSVAVAVALGGSTGIAGGISVYNLNEESHACWRGR